MRNEKLRGVFQKLGYQNVQTVISSGNVLFESPSRDVKALEAAIEEAIQSQLGFTSTTIIRNHQQLRRFVDDRPFGSIEETPTSRLNVSFLKEKRRTNLQFSLPRGKEGLYGPVHARPRGLQCGRSHWGHNTRSHGMAREAVRQSNHYPHLEDRREDIEQTRCRWSVMLDDTYAWGPPVALLWTSSRLTSSIRCANFHLYRNGSRSGTARATRIQCRSYAIVMRPLSSMGKFGLNASSHGYPSGSAK